MDCRRVGRVCRLGRHHAGTAGSAGRGSARPRSWRRWIRELSDESFRVRETATREIWELGESALPALTEAAASQDPEQSYRARDLLRKIQLHITPETDSFGDCAGGALPQGRPLGKSRIVRENARQAGVAADAQTLRRRERIRRSAKNSGPPSMASRRRPPASACPRGFGRSPRVSGTGPGGSGRFAGVRGFPPQPRHLGGGIEARP